ncbi:class I SAM-dependent methyltransferase [Legionella tunisiensis]|uniref:class I SAM-dependent methyltransferase n=1 Tax=Legionella tunisiensis TaxID=1034944 RepID=UPI00031862DB|nr:class I SAM-dependent methyltransferase [Legionella tunisiensis]
MLLFRLLPGCESYCGTDITEAGLAHIQNQLKTRKSAASIRLLKRPAHIFEPEDINAYDTVIINSVMQYFPSMNYLITVLEKAIASTTPGGRIFIGDIRSFTHLHAFSAVVQLLKATKKTTFNRWQVNIKKQMAQEEELVVSPDFSVCLLILIHALAT